ncbi:MAG TPA: DUF1367 family protein [Steroidobacteraceae bacterium]
MRIGPVLRPADAAAIEWLGKLRQGQPVMIDVRLPRNVRFLRKWFALVNIGYDFWSESYEDRPALHKGEPVLPNRDRFRKDITIMAGFYHHEVNLQGEVRVEADSLRFGSMTAEQFEDLYSSTINVLLTLVFNGKRCPLWTETQLREMAEQILEFD